MKLSSFLIVFGLSVGCLFSCKSDFESVPLEKQTLDLIFSKTDSLGKNARSFLNDLYAMMDDGHNRIGSGDFYGGDYLDASTDDAITSSLNEVDVNYLYTGRYNATDLINSDMRWGWYYRGIRQANIFIANIDVVPFMLKYHGNKPLNKALKAEARFLRAHFYFEMLKRYGGVPIIGDRVFVLGENIELPRNSFEECVNYIVNELDEMSEDLRTIPVDNTSEDAHVATVEAAMAFKARVLLYAASKLFNEEPLQQGNKFVGYESYDADRWAIAADAAKAFIDTYGPQGSNLFSLTKPFNTVFLEYHGSNNPEVIFAQQGSKGKKLEQSNGPAGFSADNLGRSQTCPTQNLVDAFPMKDGKAISDPTGKYQYSFRSMYDNRDPRLEYTVMRNGSKWLNETLETFVGGKSNPAGAVQKTKTSYHMRKFLGNYENEARYGDALHLWVMFRYAEVLLNYAEALNESAGPSDEVYASIIALRKRAGIEPGDDERYGLKAVMTQGEMRELIYNERRIELAFEEHRYWDVRRWKIAEELFSKPLRGLVIVKTAGNMTANEVSVVDPITFDKRRYLYPIPYSEVIKNRNMVQNPEW